jgi:hypothetical protein
MKITCGYLFEDCVWSKRRETLIRKTSSKSIAGHGHFTSVKNVKNPFSQKEQRISLTIERQEAVWVSVLD